MNPPSCGAGGPIRAVLPYTAMAYDRQWKIFRGQRTGSGKHKVDRMSRETLEGQILTKFEKMLDSHHRTLPLWSQPRPVGIFATLAGFDMLMLPIAIGVSGVSPNPYTVQKVKGYHDSLTHAMRFFWSDARTLDVRPTNERHVLEQAIEFLLYCNKYGVLSDLHVGNGRGLHSIEADESQKRVRFVHLPRDGSTPDPAGILEDAPSYWEHLRRANEDPSVKKRTVDAVKRAPHHWESGRLVIDDLSSFRGLVLQDALEYLLPPHELPLDDADGLTGITAKEFRAFWHALFKWSMVASGLYLEATLNGKDQNEHLPTQVVAKKRFTEGIIELSGVPEQAVVACLDRLSFGRDCPSKPDIYLQPLVCGDDQVAWSPYLIQICKYERNMLKLMARVPALKSVADNLIGSRERVLTRQFGQLLARYGYQFKTRIRLSDGSGEIDLLAFHPKHPSELLVTEIKGVLGVDEVNEVHQSTKEMIAGQGQLSRILAFLPQADLPTKAALWRSAPWNTIRSYYGLVLTANAQPNSTYDHRNLPAVTLETVARYFHERDYRSPARIWATSVEKRWLKKYASHGTTYMPLQVGEITYEIPVWYVQ
jgi:hypothetical protein